MEGKKVYKFKQFTWKELESIDKNNFNSEFYFKENNRPFISIFSDDNLHKEIQEIRDK